MPNQERLRPRGGGATVLLAIGVGSMAALGASCGFGAGSRPNSGIQALRPSNRAGASSGSQGIRGLVQPTSAAASGARDAGSAPEILSAWTAAERAFESAASTADGTEPDLAATTANPQLTFTEDLLTQMKASGEAARGPVALGRPSVVAATEAEATVRACLHDAEVIFVLATGRPVAGVAGRVANELVVSLMSKLAGGWKLVDQTVRVDACTPR